MRPESPRDETLLVRRAQAGDVTAFEALYRAHLGRIHALCLRMTGDRATAEDLTQEAFIRAWQRLDSFRGDSAFYSWIYRLAVNVVLGDFRVKKRLAERVANSEDVSDLPLAALDRPAGLRMDLEQAIATLPPGAREIFVLHDVEGYKHEEIAEITGLATGTSKAHLHRARRLLREQLQ